MSATETSCYEGLLFEGNTKDRSWALVCQNNVTMTINPPGGVAKPMAWKMVATQKDEIVWECDIGPGLRHRVKDNFVQWQRKTGVTFGLRLKTSAQALQFNSALAVAINTVTPEKTTKRSSSNVVELTIIPANGDQLSLRLTPYTTITQVMAMVAEQRKLNPAHYNLTLPAEDPKSEGVACFGSMSVSRLKTHILYLKRQPGAPEETRLIDTDTVVVQIDLPRGEKTSIRASYSTPLSELLQMACKKRRLDVKDYRFDLPATEDSLLDKTLAQLRLNTLKMVPRTECVIEKNMDTHADSPKGVNRRHAPPPPSGPAQPCKVTADLMKELSAEVTERRKGSPVHNVTTPTATPTDVVKVEQENKSHKPPIKPRKKQGMGKKVSVFGEDESKEDVDGTSSESPSIPRSELDSIVMGVKVREAAERPGMGTITEGLRLTAASGGRYLSVKKRKQMSVEEPPGHTQPAHKGNRRSMEMEDIDTHRLLHPSILAQRDTRSLRRKPRPAPAPPPGKNNFQRSATMERPSLQLTKEGSGIVAGGTLGRRPVRKAPVRHAPVKPQAKQKATPTNELPSVTINQEEDIQQQIDNLVRKKESLRQHKAVSQERESEVKPLEEDFSGYEFHPFTPPKAHSPAPPTHTPSPTHSHHSTPPPQPSPITTPRRDDVVMATVVPKEGGGKTLIIKPSPGSARKANIVFNLPPPPPPTPLKDDDVITAKNDVMPETLPVVHESHTNQTESSVTKDTASQVTVATTVNQQSESCDNHVIQGINEESILSNEYTNLDEDSEEEDRDGEMKNQPVVESQGKLPHGEPSHGEPSHGEPSQGEPSQGGCDVIEGDVSMQGEESVTAINELSYDTSLTNNGCNTSLANGTTSRGDIENGVDGDTGAVGGGSDVGDSSATGDSSDSIQQYDIISPLPASNEDYEDDVKLPPSLTTEDNHQLNITLNHNDNNNNNNNWDDDVVGFPPPPLEFIAPSEKYSTPARLSGFEMPPEPSFDDSELFSPEDEAVDLVAMTTHHDNGMKKTISGSSIKSLGTRLSELDSMVTSLTELTNEMPTPPPPPLPPVIIISPVKKSPLPPKPAPPVLLPSKKKKKPSSSSPVATNNTSHTLDHNGSLQDKDISSSLNEVVNSSMTDDVSPSSQETADISKQDRAHLTHSIEQRVNSLHSIPTPPQYPIPQTTGLHSMPPGGGDMHMFQQLLQQQLLQQQIIQLQQQFHQLQNTMHRPPAVAMTPAAMTIMQPQMYPGMVAMPMTGGVPTMGPSVAMPTSAMYGPMAMMGHTYSPHLSPSPPPPPPAPVTSTPMPTPPNQPHPQNDITVQQNKPRPPKAVTAELRTTALGQLETKFNQLMEDVKDTDVTNILRKLTPEEREGDLAAGVNSGMAAALAEALRERRKHFDTDKHNRTELEDSKLSEWDT